MEELVGIITEMGLPFAYDHFAEGESPDSPFLCYLLPGSDNFAADGKVYFKINEVRLELYTDQRIRNWKVRWKLYWTVMRFFITSRKYGSRVKNSMRYYTVLKWRE